MRHALHFLAEAQIGTVLRRKRKLRTYASLGSEVACARLEVAALVAGEHKLWEVRGDFSCVQTLVRLAAKFTFEHRFGNSFLQVLVCGQPWATQRYGLADGDKGDACLVLV